MMTADELRERLEALEAKYNILNNPPPPPPPPPAIDPETVKQDMINIIKKLP